MGDTQTLPLTFERGVLESQEDSLIPQSFAAVLENWVPEPNGCLRCRRGWLNAIATGAPATRRARGIGVLSLYSVFNTPTLVQDDEADAGGGAAATATWPAATTAGNLLVLCVAGNFDNTVTITPPGGWVLARRESRAGASVAWYYIENASSRAGGVSVNTSSGSKNIWIAEYSGMATSGVLDQNAGNSGSSTTPDSGTTAATGQAGELWLAGFSTAFEGDNNDQTNGFATLAERNSVATILRLGVYGKIVTAQGTANTSYTMTSAAWAGAVVTFKAAVAVSTFTEYGVVAHNNNANAYIIHSKNLDDLTAGSWATVETVSISAAATDFVSFASGLGQLVYSSKWFVTARRWDGAAAAAVSGGPAGKCVAFHKNRFFDGGTNSNPTRLWYSDLGSYSSWPATNYVEIGENDGEAIEDVAVFEDGLLIAKRNSLWFLSGSGPDDFSVNRLNVGGGMPGRCILPTPYGALIAGKNSVWLWPGSGVEVVSTRIESSYSISGDFVSSAYIDGVGYICDEGTGTIFAIELQRGVWWSEKVSSVNEGPAVVGRLPDDRLVYGPQAAATISLLAYRDHPKGARARDVSLSQTFKAWTPEMWPGGPEQVVTPLYLHLKIRQRGGNAAQDGPVLTPVYDGVPEGSEEIVPEAAAGVFRRKISLASKQGVDSVQLRLEHTVPNTEAALMDIEEAVLEYDLEPAVR